MRRLLIAAVVLAVVLLIAVALLLRSLRGGDLRATVESRLSAALGQPVSIGRIGVTVLPLAFSGTAVRVGESRAQAPALDIERVRIVPRLGPLLSGSLVVEQLGLDGFVISVLRDEAGKWHVPSIVPAPTAAGAGGPAVERVRVSGGRVRVFDRGTNSEVHETSSIDDIDAEVSIDRGGLRFAPIMGRVGGAAISGEARTDAKAVTLAFTTETIGNEDLPSFVRLLGADHPAFLGLGEPASVSVSLRVDRVSSRLTGTGRLRAPQVRLEPLRHERFEAPFMIDGPRFTFKPTTFTIYGGTHDGTVSMRLDETPATWTADSAVRGLRARDFLNALAGGDQRLEGTASLVGPLRGRVGEALDRGVSGRMQVVVSDGVIRRFPLLASINRALRLTEEQDGDTRFERLSGTFAIAAGQATTNDLVLQAGHLRVETAGRIGADRSIALRGVAVLSPERSARAIASVHELTGLRNRSGEIEFPLTISGSLDAPSFGIDLKAAIGKGIRDELRRQLRRIIKR